MNGVTGYRRRRLRLFAASWVGFVALLGLTAASAQAAPPAKNAERRCVDAGGTFVWEPTGYTCSGLPSSPAVDSERRSCMHAYKGWAFTWFQDPLTGQWAYICSR
jgi:hypothetical protein